MNLEMLTHNLIGILWSQVHNKVYTHFVITTRNTEVMPSSHEININDLCNGQHKFNYLQSLRWIFGRMKISKYSPNRVSYRTRQ
jgi:hypothetical protein